MESAISSIQAAEKADYLSLWMGKDRNVHRGELGSGISRERKTTFSEGEDRRCTVALLTGKVGGSEEARLFPEELKDNIQSPYERLLIAHRAQGIRVLEGVDGKIKYIIPVTTSQGQYLTNSSQKNLETTYSSFKLATVSKRAC